MKVIEGSEPINGYTTDWILSLEEFMKLKQKATYLKKYRRAIAEAERLLKESDETSFDYRADIYNELKRRYPVWGIKPEWKRVWKNKVCEVVKHRDGRVLLRSRRNLYPDIEFTTQADAIRAGMGVHWKE